MIGVLVSPQDHIASFAAITAIGAAFRHKLFPPKAHTPAPTISSLGENSDPIHEHDSANCHRASILSFKVPRSKIFLRNRVPGAFLLPINAHDPPTITIVEKLGAIDPAHEWFWTVHVMARLIRTPGMRDIAKPRRRTRDLVFVKPVLRKIRIHTGDESFNIENCGTTLPLSSRLATPGNKVGMRRAPGM